MNLRRCLYRCLYLGLAVGLAVGLSAQSVHLLTAAHALQVRRLSDLRFSPDGARLAFTVAEPPRAADNPTHIWILDVAARQARQYTYSAHSESSPRWSPDGKFLAFLSDRGHGRQIYLLPTAGGEAYPLTHEDAAYGPIAAFAWSPDGASLAFLAANATTPEEKKKDADKDDAIVVDHAGKDHRVWLFRLATRSATPLTDAPWSVASLAWTPDGEQLVLAATNRPASDDNTEAIYSLAVAHPALGPHLLFAPRGPFGDLQLSPDGRQLAYLGARVDGPEPGDVYVRALAAPADQPSRDLTAASLDRAAGDIAWRPDGSLWITAQNGFHRELVRLSPAGAAAPLPAAVPNPRGLALARDGAYAFTGGTATSPPEVYLAEAGAAPRRVTDLNGNWAGITLAHPGFFHFASFDGTPIEGELLLPLDGKTKDLPTVILVHGGPTGAWSDAVDSWGQLLAAHGFAVAYFNIRGSTGYGYKFMTANRADWGGNDFKDVMAGVDYLVQQGVADPNRLGIGGWSYGGYMSEWAITQTNRFKAAVSGAGMVDLITEFSSENGPAYDKWFWGLPYEHSALMLKQSPLLYLQRAHTPILILQGIADTTDPLDESTGLYRGLKFYGAPAELVEYPRENHGFHEQQHQLDRLNRIVAWYQKYLG